MKQGKTLVELATEIQAQAKMKRDYIAPAGKLTMQVEGVTPVLGMQNGHVQRYGMTDVLHEQVGARLEIPKPYYERMRVNAPALLAGNVNHWLGVAPERKFMVRTLGDQARALLSDRYRPLDHADLLESVLPKLIESGCRIESCDVTERRLYLKAVAPRTEANVAVGDVVQAGVLISNSEVGLGSVRVEPLVYRLVCKNGAIVNDLAMKRAHIGRRSHGLEFEQAEEFFKDETRMADDRAFFLKVNDVVSALLDQALFTKIVSRWKEAKGQAISADPVEVVERTAKRLNLSDSERSGVLTYLIQGGELSAYGLMNAVTRMAQDVDSYDRSTELERVGAGILELPRQAWRELAEVA